MAYFRDVFHLQRVLKWFMQMHPQKDRNVPLIQDLSLAGEATRLLNDVVEQIFKDQGLVGEEAKVENVRDDVELSVEALMKVVDFNNYIQEHP